MKTKRRENSLPARLRQRMASLPRRTKRAIMVVADAAGIILAAAGALWLTGAAPPFEGVAIPIAVLLALVALPLFRQLGLYRSIVRFMGLDLVVAAFRSVLVLAPVGFLLSLPWMAPLEALRVAMAFSALLLVYVAGSRFTVRIFFQLRYVPADRVLIYGAGEGGVRLASSIAGGQQFMPVAFVDDSHALVGSVINGLEVYGPDQMPRLIKELDISRVLLAMPSVSRRRRRRILNRLEQLPVHVQTMPAITDLISGHAQVDEIREVDVADLLGRDPIPPNDKLLDACIRGKSVLVTGAGGSIGAELCRQILQLGPKCLVLLEISEAALYTIDKELGELETTDGLPPRVVPLLGSAHHKNRVRDVLQTYDVDTVYHAAAYKHVPLVEHNMLEGIHNNLFGTLHTAEAAVEAGVKHFVLVSTDKAVWPTNVMGATKRFAELALQAIHNRGTATTFSMVRFGNVLASSGSVVPLFREQIRNGGPVTVTHPEIIRYFMTIPEAAQLVIQAGSMARGSDVFVLDMGKPVRIKDLAEKMIHLMGLTVQDDDHPDGDIEIAYTGLRPAEKLYEELLIGNNVTGTEHPMIMRAQEDFLPWPEFKHLSERVWEACQALDCELARIILLEAVAGYTPTDEVEDLVFQQRERAPEAAAAAAKIADLKAHRASRGS
jgi:FlaA1/EpsC-like NDP-sugar epimerase